jgi:hypothetical protein
VGNSPRNVFINCPFDDAYRPIFRALVFAIYACGFRPRCALELDDGSETRIDKLYRIIEECRFGIHDISRTELDAHNQLPRFNMPLELGVFLGAKRFGDADQRRKRCLVFDRERYRFQMFISDIAGMDVTVHECEPRIAVERTRDWLVSGSRRRGIPAPAGLLRSYDAFTADLAGISEAAGLDPERLTFPDFASLVVAWVRNASVE